jgi:hypothetical protein
MGGQGAPCSRIGRILQDANLLDSLHPEHLLIDPVRPIQSSVQRMRLTSRFTNGATDGVIDLILTPVVLMAACHASARRHGAAMVPPLMSMMAPDVPPWPSHDAAMLFPSSYMPDSSLVASVTLKLYALNLSSCSLSQP